MDFLNLTTEEWEALTNYVQNDLVRKIKLGKDKIKRELFQLAQYSNLDDSDLITFEYSIEVNKGYIELALSKIREFRGKK